MEISIIKVLGMIFTFKVIFAIFAGSVLGLIVGALPGIGPVTAMAAFLPLTFKLDPVTSVAFLGSVWASGIYGGSWTAILVNVPGTSMSVATSLDGYPMSRQGRALEALGAATMSAFFGGLTGVLILCILAPIIAKYVVMFGPPEYVWVNLLAIVVIATCFQGSMIKGILAGFIGISLSLFGLDAVLGVPRYTFGLQYLQDGIGLIPAMVGLFGFGEVISMLLKTGSVAETGKLQGNLWTGFISVIRHFRAAVVGLVVGTIIGIIPGIGGSAANFLAYSEAKRRSKHPETFGQGNVEGIISSETAINAIEGTSLIPALTLGIPGSASAAILLMALIIQGFQPGMSLFKENGSLVAAFFGTLILSQLAMVIVGLLMMRILSLMTLLPNEMLATAVCAFCVIGVYSINHNLTDVFMAVIFGYVGYFMKEAGFPIVGLVVGLILGGATERAFTQSLEISGGQYAIFFTRPLSLTLLALIVLLIVSQIRRQYAKEKVSSAPTT